MKHDTHARHDILESVQRTRQQLGGRRRRVAEMQFAALAARHSPGGLHGFLRPVQHRTCLRGEDPARLGEAHRFGATFQQWEAQFILEVTNLAAQGRLRHVQLERRP